MVAVMSVCDSFINTSLFQATLALEWYSKGAFVFDKQLGLPLILVANEKTVLLHPIFR
jgi:hypothetical protein